MGADGQRGGAPISNRRSVSLHQACGFLSASNTLTLIFPIILRVQLSWIRKLRPHLRKF